MTKPMGLGEKQELFSRLLPPLLNKAHELGFEVRIGDLFRDPRVFGEMGESKGYGHRNSCHKLKLSVDLNLMRDGVLMADSASHKELGEWWKQQHELCRWGGNFKNRRGEPKPDGNHYSMAHHGYA